MRDTKMVDQEVKQSTFGFANITSKNKPLYPDIIIQPQQCINI